MDISCRITPDNIVTVKYNADINTSKNTSTTNALLIDELREVRTHWKSLGYDDVEIDLSNTMYQISMTATIEKKCASREEAFDTLYEIMTSEISIFDNVDYLYEKNYYQEYYSLNGIVDISALLDKEEIARVYPEYALTDLESNFENSSFKLTFSLPTDAPAPDKHIEMNVVSQHLSHDEPSEFSTSGIITNYENVEYELATINNNKENYKNLLLFGTPAILLLLIIIFLIIARRKANKIKTDSESYLKEDNPSTPE